MVAFQLVTHERSGKASQLSPEPRDAPSNVGPDRSAFARVRNAEADYGRRLRMVAKQVEELARAFAQPGVSMDMAHLADMLDRYSVLIAPWARAVASRFVAEVARRDEAAWAQYAKGMSRALEAEIRTAPTGEMLRDFLETQVQLITSLPLQAAQRVHELATGQIYSGARYGELIEEIMRTGQVTRNRATLIARTETARVSSALTMVRATHVGIHALCMADGQGSPCEVIAQEDGRPVIAWNDPPTPDIGVPPYHAGMIWNCSCFCRSNPS